MCPSSDPLSSDATPATELDESGEAKQSRFISKVLTAAVRLWLRTQLDQVEELQLTIEAGDRQLMSGCLEQVAAIAEKAVYQGLHFSRVQVTAQQIQTNLRQVLRGKPFRLLAAFPVTGAVYLSEADLNASLASPLFANAVIDGLLVLARSTTASDGLPLPTAEQSFRLHEPQMWIEAERLRFQAALVAEDGTVTPVAIAVGLCLEQGNRLRLRQPHWLQDNGESRPLAALDGYTFDLGPDVCLEEFTLQSQQILCRGQINVQP